MLQPFLESVLKEGEYSAIFFGGEFSHGVQKTQFRVITGFKTTLAPPISPMYLMNLILKR